jgi:hypothetical protein
VPQYLVEVFLRLRISSLPGCKVNELLWKSEPELLYDGEAFLVPRVLPSNAMNDRYNAARRLITKTAYPEQTCIEVVSTGKSLGLVQNSLDLQQKAPSVLESMCDTPPCSQVQTTNTPTCAVVFLKPQIKLYCHFRGLMPRLSKSPLIKFWYSRKDMSRY